ncbi:hypothetical protein GUJ93_ZPchr0001g30814 [Zizania palustris]|uniref:Uncharacterized protein n=1 Tax=Zizania palustris TaxID=103762 RepID=A0A8J5V964_ZIZPA|nr:hypothetical protein GUJ93_ZPchr0001g30814 [Zizania palustris]
MEVFRKVPTIFGPRRLRSSLRPLRPCRPGPSAVAASPLLLLDPGTQLVRRFRAAAASSFRRFHSGNYRLAARFLSPPLYKTQLLLLSSGCAAAPPHLAANTFAPPLATTTSEFRPASQPPSAVAAPFSAEHPLKRLCTHRCPPLLIRQSQRALRAANSRNNQVNQEENKKQRARSPCFLSLIRRRLLFLNSNPLHHLHIALDWLAGCHPPQPVAASSPSCGDVVCVSLPSSQAGRSSLRSVARYSPGARGAGADAAAMRSATWQSRMLPPAADADLLLREQL